MIHYNGFDYQTIEAIIGQNNLIGSTFSVHWSESAQRLELVVHAQVHYNGKTYPSVDDALATDELYCIGVEFGWNDEHAALVMTTLSPEDCQACGAEMDHSVGGNPHPGECPGCGQDFHAARAAEVTDERAGTAAYNRKKAEPAGWESVPPAYDVPEATAEADAHQEDVSRWLYEQSLGADGQPLSERRYAQ